MNLPKKKYAEIENTAEYVDIRSMKYPEKWDIILDSKGMKQLADYWKETIRLRAMKIRVYTDEARKMEMNAFRYLEGKDYGVL